MNKKKIKSTELKSMRLDAELIDRLNEIADKENRNFTNTVETLLLKATKEYEMV